MRLASLTIITAALALPAAAKAESDGVELELTLSAGAGMDGSPEQWIGGLLAGARLRFHPRVPVALYGEAYIPWGAGGGLMFDIYRDSVIRLHAEAGAYGYWAAGGRLAGHPGIPWGLTYGAGLEITFGDGALLVDTRAYLPDPQIWFSSKDSPDTFGESFKHLQLFIGYGRRF